MSVFISCHFFLFKIYQVSSKSAFKTHVFNNLNHLEQIKLYPSLLYTNTKNIKWCDDNNEIELDNQLYDVVYIKNTGTTGSIRKVGGIKI